MCLSVTKCLPYCRFKSDCSYNHKESTNKVEMDLVSKVNALEKPVSEMAVKLISLEIKLKETEKVQIPSENIEEIEEIAEEQAKEVFQVIKKSTNKDTTEKVKKLEAVKENNERKKTKACKNSYKCEVCDYTCKKFETLSKHKTHKSCS